MTMHLVRGMTGLNTKKAKKRKLTTGKIDKYQKQMFAHNKDLRSKGLHDLQMNLDDFIAYCHGEYKAKPKPRTKAKDWLQAKPYVREQTHVPSIESFSGSTARPDPKVYTGTLIKGIATMHKSNAVPIIDKKQAEEISNMRR